MKLSLLAVAGALLVAVVVVSSRVAGAPASLTSPSEPALLRLPRATPAGQTTLFGHVKSLTRKGGRWEMRFDPALVLQGAAAEHAALEDTGSSDVPNDSVTLEEGHRLLTYVVAPNVAVTVLVMGLRAITIPVSEVAQIVKGKNPRQRPLFDRANGLGFWIRVGDKYPNPVLSIDQQYHP
jgi:hypothetical protein